MKFLFFWAITLSFHQSAKSSECEQIMMEVDQSEPLIFLVHHLLEEKMIDQKMLDYFIKKIEQGKMINPIPHADSNLGVTFSSPKFMIYYNQFNFFVDLFEKDRNSYNLAYLNEKLKILSEKLQETLLQKIETEKATSLTFLIEKWGSLNQDFSNSQLALLAENAPRFLKLAAAQLKLTDNLDHQIKAELILLQLNPQRSYQELLRLITPDPKNHHYFARALREGNTDDPESLAYALKNLFIDDQDKKNKLISRLAPTQNSSIINAIKFLAHSREYLRASLSYLSGSSPKNYQKFLHELFAFYAGEESSHEAYLVLIEILKLTKDFDYFKNKVTLYPDLKKEILNDYRAFEDKQPLSIEQIIPFIEEGLFSHQRQTISYASQMLGLYRYRYPDHPWIIKTTQQLLSKGKDILSPVDKLILLYGVEEDSAYQRIIQGFEVGNPYKRRKAYAALGGRSDQKSKDLILKYGEKPHTHADIGLALVGRPESDLIFFLNAPGTLPSYALNYLNLFYQNRSNEVIELAKKMAKENSEYVNRAWAIDYLSKLPKEDHLPFWKELASNKYERTSALEFLYGTNDLETRAIFKATVQSDDQPSAMNSYLFCYFSALEKTLSANPNEVKQGHQELVELDEDLILKVLK